MTTTLSNNGLLEIPEAFRKADALQPGQLCEIERLGKGEYRVRVSLRTPSEKPNDSLVALLSSCPVKGFFTPAERTETTDDLKCVGFE